MGSFIGIVLWIFVMIWMFSAFISFLSKIFKKTNNTNNQLNKYEKIFMGQMEDQVRLGEAMFQTACEFAGKLEVSPKEIPGLGNAFALGQLLNEYFSLSVKVKLSPNDKRFHEIYNEKHQGLVVGISNFFLPVKLAYKPFGERLIIGMKGLAHVSFFMEDYSKKNLSERIQNHEEVIPLKTIRKKFPKEFDESLETLLSSYRITCINSEVQRYPDEFKLFMENLDLFALKY